MPSSPHDLAVAICAMNSSRTIRQTLRSVSGLARRMVVVDSGSTDGTQDVCRDLGAEVIHREWTGYASQKQFAIDQCRDHRWVLLLDSDEALEPDLREAMARVLEQDDAAYDGWNVNRKLWFLGGWLNHTYQPEWRLRLVRGGKGRVVGDDPHDRIEIDGKVGFLQGDLRHDSYANLTDLAKRQIHYAQVAASSSQRTSWWRLLLHPPAAFIKALILKKAALDGWRGLVVASLAASSTMLKHAFRMEAQLVSSRGSADTAVDAAQPNAERSGAME